jgi:hypothetical protein
MPKNPGSPAFSIPGCKSNTPPLPCGGLSNNTSFANVTMETFFQANVSTSCMACHNLTKNVSDFNWTLANHAYSKTNPVAPLAFGVQTRASVNALRMMKQKPTKLTPEQMQLKALMATGRSRPATTVGKPKTTPRGTPKPVKKKN